MVLNSNSALRSKQNFRKKRSSKGYPSVECDATDDVSKNPKLRDASLKDFNMDSQKMSRNKSPLSVNTNTMTSKSPKSQQKSPKSPASPSAIAKKLVKSIKHGFQDMHKNNSVQYSVSTKGISSIIVSPTSERIVMGTSVLDRIEVAMKECEYRDDDAHVEMEVEVELMHVLGTSSIDHGVNNEMRDESVGLINNHTTPVQQANMCTRYHPICDFTLRHRIPTSSNKLSRLDSSLGFSDKYALLQGYQTVEEHEAAGNECMHTCSEIKAIENERNNIHQKMDEKILITPQEQEMKRWYKCAELHCQAQFDINKYLDEVNYKRKVFKSSKTSISLHERIYLQKRRGEYIHAGFTDPDKAKNFAMKCRGNRKGGYQSDLVTQMAKTCLYKISYVSSTALNVRNIAITMRDDCASFFVSKDDGKAYYDNAVPARLTERIENVYTDPKGHTGTIRYLSCGPNGSYYAELASGLVFWRTCPCDEKFHSCLTSVQSNVHRVAFGSFDTDNSWIIVTKDGDVIWRNIPCRLSEKLRSRTPDMPSVSEISLGGEGCYFIRFLDGEVDYCLPAFIDELVAKLLQNGAEINSIALHPESADNFIIRHSSIN